MPKKAGILFVIAGTVLILAALSLFLYNRFEDAQAGRNAENLLAGVQSAMEKREMQGTGSAEGKTVTPSEIEEPTEPLDPELPAVELDGYEYVGVISIPALELELPVMSEWDYDRLRIAPCRQFGSSRTDDLVIAAHNYENHFGRLNNLNVGDTVIFTDMDGIVNTYSVEEIKTLQPTEVDAVQNSGYDLVLYTCTKGGRTRVTVFCSRVPQVSPVPAVEPATQ